MTFSLAASTEKKYISQLYTTLFWSDPYSHDTPILISKDTSKYF